MTTGAERGRERSARTERARMWKHTLRIGGRRHRRAEGTKEPRRDRYDDIFNLIPRRIASHDVASATPSLTISSRARHIIP